MQSFSYLAAIPFSFFSRSLYRDVAARWDGMGLMYLFWITAVSFSLSLAHTGYVMKQSFTEMVRDSGLSLEDVAESLIAQWPTLEYHDGEMHVTEGEDPTVIQIFMPDAEPFPLILIKMDGGIHDFGTNPDAGPWAILTAKAIHFRKSDDQIETRIWANEDIKDGSVIDQQALQEAYNELMQWLQRNQWTILLIGGGLIWAFGMVGMFIFRFIQVLIGGLMGQMIGSFMGVSLSYDIAVRLATVAFTPVWLLHLLASWLHSPLETWHAFTIALAGLVFAVYANHEKHGDTPAPDARAS